MLRALIIGGTSATGDVLVAADGASSAVRQQYLPHARVNDAGIVAIGGKVAVTTDTTALLPPECFLGLSLVFAPKGLESLVSIMTGGTSGIGASAAWLFAAERRCRPPTAPPWRRRSGPGELTIHQLRRGARL